ncbi:MAG: 23S rRNA (uracil(1939)-C(5))-methyltransferase RlmD [Chitinophagaceae bacterium]|nr:MAG: 23S rRNA (uracil(1939)-C(5))-methyltransferase RlmD [Chitinophagaceae bacterium]
MRKKQKPRILEGVTVEAYAAEGKSLARQDGKVIFIEGAVPGDVVDVRLGKSKKDWAEGQAVHFHQYAQERVAPFCQHFGVCGGCQWQMLPYHKQLEYKQQQVFDNLTRIGKIQLPPFEPIVGAPEDRFYRNKLEYTFSTKEFTPGKPQPHPQSLPGAEGSEPPPGESYDDPQPGSAGFHARGFFDKVVAIEKCWLQEDITNRIRNGVRDFARAQGISFYDIRNHVGMLRTMQVRLCTTGELMVNIVFGEEREKQRVALLEYVKQSFPEITTLLYTINLKWNDSMFDLDPQVYTGKGYAIEQLEDFRFKIGPKSFFQTNTKQGERLYQVTREYAELDGSQVLYDLYCGTGSIGIFCSRGAKKIVGVELIEAAIADAKENAALNNIGHTFFTAGDVIDVCNDAFFAEHGRPDVLITDPPRAGMHEKLVHKILDMEAPTVVYVSCNPATQARDLALLDAKYAITRVRPVDMFPHTHHIENVVQLKRR